MKIRKFTEYLNDKGKLQEKPIVDPLADTAPKGPKKPEKQALKGKDWTAEAAAVKDTPAPYSAPGTDPGQPKYEKGFAYDGEKKLIYDPDTTDQRLMKTWPKSEMEKYHMETKNMSTSQFMQYIKEKQNVDAAGLQKINEAAKMLSENEYLMQHFIREVRRNKGFGSLIKEAFSHTESYEELAYLMVDEKVCRSFAKALHEITEMVDDPVKKRMTDTSGMPKPPSEKSDLPKGRKRPHFKGVHDAFDGEDIVATGQTAPAMGDVQPEHNLIRALARYQSFVTAMNEVSKESAEG